jgi:hypothetical protein
MFDYKDEFISLFPGSDIHGVPASETKTILKLAFSNKIISSIFSYS